MWYFVVKYEATSFTLRPVRNCSAASFDAFFLTAASAVAFTVAAFALSAIALFFATCAGVCGLGTVFLPGATGPFTIGAFGATFVGGFGASSPGAGGPWMFDLSAIPSLIFIRST